MGYGSIYRSYRHSAVLILHGESKLISLPNYICHGRYLWIFILIQRELFLGSFYLVSQLQGLDKLSLALLYLPFLFKMCVKNWFLVKPCLAEPEQFLYIIARKYSVVALIWSLQVTSVALHSWPFTCLEFLNWRDFSQFCTWPFRLLNFILVYISNDFQVRFFCNILRVRWESTRSRTKERALVMMEKLVWGAFHQFSSKITFS